MSTYDNKLQKVLGFFKIFNNFMIMRNPRRGKSQIVVNLHQDNSYMKEVHAKEIVLSAMDAMGSDKAFIDIQPYDERGFKEVTFGVGDREYSQSYCFVSICKDDEIYQTLLRSMVSYSISQLSKEYLGY